MVTVTEDPIADIPIVVGECFSDAVAIVIEGDAREYCSHCNVFHNGRGKGDAEAGSKLTDTDVVQVYVWQESGYVSGPLADLLDRARGC